ncbi:uncharacterized protein LOC109597263 [Aethina tumida]|uniref:uncharacterized protein LOC109597263 n=1 Tax=Aethina tumida TaxID=116153 RepID=UPI00096B4B71|nr:uncharacterized protein LOC109597263 [Aethina tumida]XP_049817521.1 uncharacterized protein LOC109597263 [Aethina tumida]
MMSPSQFCIFCLVNAIVPIWSAFPPSLRYPLPVAINRITDLSLSCDSQSINITVEMQHPFKGLLFAKDFAQECKSIGVFSNTVSISLPTSGCGVRLNSRSDENGFLEMFYSVTVIVQQDRHLRQITDQERIVQCSVNDSAFLVKSKPMQDVIRNELTSHVNNHRVGRMKKLEGWSKEFDDEPIEQQLNETLLAARAWMEIVPEQVEDRPFGTLQVGETALLSVKSTLPSGIGWKVVDCVAHDGLGDSSQKLLDEQGCPVDDVLLPIPTLGPVRPIAMMRHQEAVSRFSAFKFPDRDRLHLSCGLQLCRKACPEVDCNSYSDTFENRLGRQLSKGSDGEVLDRLEVFNSVEVLAPEIDDLRKSERYLNTESPTYPFTNLPGDRTFCVSPDKMAIAFCILGLIFLTAVVIAACALLRARRTGVDVPYYTRSLFSSSSGGGGSAFGSKLLLHESPCMGQSASNRGLQYGRIL